MRYTTIIDITELPDLWRNANASRVYMYMVLRSGYHDDDRDMLRVSLRRLALVTGCSVAATRHALHMLQKLQLLKKEGDKWLVLKFVVEKKPTPRTQKNTASNDSSISRMMDEQRANEETLLKKKYYLQNASVDELRELLSFLEKHARKVLNGFCFYSSDQTKNTINKWIEYKLRQ